MSWFEWKAYSKESRQKNSERTRLPCAGSIRKQDARIGWYRRLIRCMQAVTTRKEKNGLYRWLRRSRLEPIKRVALTLRKNGKEILNVFITRLTNAICEEIISMIQTVKRKERGYHTFEGFSSMIYLIAGKLKLACPNPLR